MLLKGHFRPCLVLGRARAGQRGTSRKLFALLFSQMSNACVGEEFIANCFFPLMPHHYSEAWKAKSLIILFKVYKCPKEQGILLLRNVA